MDKMDHTIQVQHSKQFLSLLMRYQARIHTYILYQVPNRSDAEDILQDTIVLMMDKYSQFQEGTNFLAWGITIARYKILSFRQKHRNSKLLFDDGITDLIDREAPEQFDTFDEEAQALRHCIAQLSPKYKKYLRLRYEHSLSYRKISEQVGISMQAVYKTMSRIHVILHNCVRLGFSGNGEL